MTLFHVSIVGNAVLLIIIGIFALDRRYFRTTCILRHNPIDQAITEIKANLQRIWDKLNAD